MHTYTHIHTHTIWQTYFWGLWYISEFYEKNSDLIFIRIAVIFILNIIILILYLRAFAHKDSEELEPDQMVTGRTVIYSYIWL